MLKRFLAAAVAALLLPACVSAQVTVPYVKNPQGQRVAATPVITVDANGDYAAGGGGGGTSDASAANQTAVQATAGADATKAVAVQGVTGGKAVPVSLASQPLPTGASTLANDQTYMGSLTETAPASDTASSGLNGRLQRVAVHQTIIEGKLDTLIASNAAINTKTTDLQTAANDPTSAKVQGGVASGSTASENPVPTGCRAETTSPTAVADGQMVDRRCTITGEAIVALSNPEYLVSGAITTAMTGTTSTSLLAAPGASLRNYITEISCTNTHASVDTLVNVQDGSGGTVLAQLSAPHAYGGHQKTFGAPLRQPTANTALYVVDVTTGASVTCSATGFKAP